MQRTYEIVENLAEWHTSEVTVVCGLQSAKMALGLAKHTCNEMFWCLCKNASGCDADESGPSKVAMDFADRLR